MLHKSFLCQHFSIQLFEIRYKINKRTDLLYVTDQLVSLRQKFSNFLEKFARSHSRSISVLLWTMIIHASFSIFLLFSSFDQKHAVMQVISMHLKQAQLFMFGNLSE